MSEIIVADMTDQEMVDWANASIERNAELQKEVERLTAELERYKKAYATCAMALALCDSTNPDKPVLDGNLWAKAMLAIDEIDAKLQEKDDELLD